jgi:hypothetical protein
MPRASTEITDEAPKRAPRKRAVRRTVPKAEAPVRRTRTPRATTSKTREGETVSAAPARRAPTPFAARAEASGTARKRLMVVVGVLLVAVSVAAFIGFSDSGQIDVSSRINEANSRTPVATQEVQGGDGTQTEGQIPVQNNTPPAAISGLKGRGVGTPPVTQEAPPTEPATTTDATASTTEEVTNENDPALAEEGTASEGEVTE